MGTCDYGKKREELQDSVIRIMYVTNHGCKSITVQSHKDHILKIINAISYIPNPTNIPVKGILTILTFMINQTATASNDKPNLASILKNVLTDEKIVDIENYFQSLDEYLRNQYPSIQNNANKVQQLNAEVKTVREHCTTLYNTMIKKTSLPVEPFWFFVSGIKIHLLLLKELIQLGSLQQQSYNADADEHCQKINWLKLKFMDPTKIEFQYETVVTMHRESATVMNSFSILVPELKSHDGKVYKILSAEHIGIFNDEKLYIDQIKAWIQEYYNDQMAKIDALVENLRNSSMGSIAN